MKFPDCYRDWQEHDEGRRLQPQKHFANNNNDHENISRDNNLIKLITYPKLKVLIFYWKNSFDVLETFGILENMLF